MERYHYFERIDSVFQCPESITDRCFPLFLLSGYQFLPARCGKLGIAT